MSINDKVKLLQMENGKLPAFAWPGGYPIFYLAADCEIVCPDCANGENGAEFQNPEYADDKQWTLIDYGVNYEDDSMYCANCNAQIESAYGDPDAEDEETENGVDNVDPVV